LLDENKDKTLRRVIDSLAAVIVADAASGMLAWDADASSWHTWKGTHWDPQTNGHFAERLIADAVHEGTDPLGYRLAYLQGITQIIQRRGLLPTAKIPDNLVPFLNGLLDPNRGTLTPATPTCAADWVLPHRYDKTAQCPTIKKWLLDSVEGDKETVELLRAWLAALLRGIALQRFLMLLGRGGSGKGTFQRLVTALVGIRNTAISTLGNLEENRFEVAKLYGKRLCMINEAGKHGGALNMLKAITGGDHLPLERKHVQQSGSFVFGGLVLLATNEDMQSSDSTSGLERRRLTVRFPRVVTPEERAAWEAKGGEEAVLHAEIPGLVNWLLELSPAEIRSRIEKPPARVVADNLLGMAAGNSVADWMLECCAFDPVAISQIGVRREIKTGSEAYFENSKTWLYASYLTHARETGRNHPVSIKKFQSTVVDIGQTLGHALMHMRDPKSRAYSIKGLRLLRDGETLDHPSGTGRIAEPSGRDNPLKRNDRKDSADIYSNNFADDAEAF
jgi:putative DNA primase/helicase